MTYTVSFLVNQTVLGIYIPYCKSVPDFHKNFPDSDATTLPCPHPSDKEGHFSGITKQTVCLPFFVLISCPGSWASTFCFDTLSGQARPAYSLCRDKNDDIFIVSSSINLKKPTKLDF